MNHSRKLALLLGKCSRVDWDMGSPVTSEPRVDSAPSSLVAGGSSVAVVSQAQVAALTAEAAADVHKVRTNG